VTPLSGLLETNNTKIINQLSVLQEPQHSPIFKFAYEYFLLLIATISPTYRFMNSDRTNKLQNGGGAKVPFPL